MSEFESAALLLALLLVASALGFIVQNLLRDRHKTRDSVESVRLVITMLVTFAALVLGLLTSSAKNAFDTEGDSLRVYAIDLIRLDQALRDYGTNADPPRVQLRVYTAAAIASTWPDEPAPAGDYYPRQVNPVRQGSLESRGLGAMLDRIAREIEELTPQDGFHAAVLADLRRHMGNVLQTRWQLVEQARSSISTPFLVVLMLWLIVIFAVFGLTSPRNGLIYVVILLSALSVSSALFLILELETPLSGWLVIPSAPMRDALDHQSRPPLPAS